ncbi:MAG: protein-export chaperone SecB [Gammaproteobacteria bacterium]|nr:protein-export chaperone SecB [Gammaproteobacteria bacterium]
MAAEDIAAGATPAEPTQGGRFGIQKIYIKDLSFETPHSPQIFQEEWKPTVNLDLSSTATAIMENIYEVVLSVTVTVSFEEKTVYLAEVEQAGIFQIQDLPKEVLARVLATVCPNILFPFAREVVADLAMRGGFPQLLIAPMNFEALYAQHQQQQAAAAAAKPAPGEKKH